MGRGLSKQQCQVLAAIVFTKSVSADAAPSQVVRRLVWQPATLTDNEHKAKFSNVQRASMARTLRRLQGRGLIEPCDLQQKALWKMPSVDGYMLTEAGQAIALRHHNELLAIYIRVPARIARKYTLGNPLIP